MNRYYNPVQTVEGAGCIRELPNLLGAMSMKRNRVLLLVWSESVLDLPAVTGLADAGFTVRSMVFRVSNPTVEQLFETYETTREFAPEAVVAVGGGSIMDVGKSLCCLYGKKLPDTDSLRRLMEEKSYGQPAARWIGIPTTAGTGSEVTCWATIWDPERDVKRSMECRENYAFAALVDPELAAGMPLRLAVSSALDAVAHAVESYWARGTNAVSQGLALEAIRTIMGSMDGLLAGTMEAHEAMARGSMLAGLAFSNTKTTACHSISYPLTMHCGIPHGAAVSMLLGPVFRLNIQGLPQSGPLLDALGVSGPDQLEERICGILHRSGQPATLREWGARREDLPRLAQLGLTKGRADNNPVPIDPATILSILEQIYERSANREENQENKKGA